MSDAASRTIECLSCGTDVMFEPGQVERPCPGCAVTVPIPVRLGADIPEHDMGTPSIEGRVPRRSVLQCPGCKVVISTTARSEFCPYCRAGLAARSNEWALITPDGILPFLLTKAQARAALTEEFKRLGAEGGPQELYAVYCPWWIMAWDVEALYSGHMGVVESYEDAYGNMQTHTVWSPAGGRVDRPWAGVQQSGSTGLRPSVAGRLSPWDYAFCEPYSPSALGDIPGEHTVIAPRDVMARHRNRVHKEIRQEVKNAIGGDKQSIDSVDLDVKRARYQLLMVPIWVGISGKGQRVIINARTAEVVVQGYAAQQVTEDDVLEVPGGETRQILWVTAIVLALAGLLYWIA